MTDNNGNGNINMNNCNPTINSNSSFCCFCNGPLSMDNTCLDMSCHGSFRNAIRDHNREKIISMVCSMLITQCAFC